jgi:hypothetical protein
MSRVLVAFFLALLLAAPHALADDRLNAREIRSILPGKWSGSYKTDSLVLTVTSDGIVRGRFGGIAATGRWTTKRVGNGDRVCLTFSVLMISETKCGELFRRGNNILYGFLNRGKPRLWLRRS